MQLLRRADREAEGARLLSEYAPKGHLGFESPALRQLTLPKGPHVGPFCFCGNVSWGFEPERVRASSKRGAFVARRQEGRQAFAAGGVAEQPRTSPALRQLILPKGPYVGPFCFCRTLILLLGQNLFFGMCARNRLTASGRIAARKAASGRRSDADVLPQVRYEQ